MQQIGFLTQNGSAAQSHPNKKLLFLHWLLATLGQDHNAYLPPPEWQQ